MGGNTFNEHNRIEVDKPQEVPDAKRTESDKDITTIHDAYEEFIKRYGNHWNNNTKEDE